jgi:hypothetical protein
MTRRAFLRVIGSPVSIALSARDSQRGVVEQFAQRLCRKGLHLVHAMNGIAAWLTNG